MSRARRAARRPLAGVFHRILLSHLTLVFLCFLSGMTVFLYLFEPGVRFFLTRSPVVLVPVLLALIGIAGLLSVWAAAAIARPIDRLTSAASRDALGEELADVRSPAGSEEVAQLRAALRSRMSMQPGGTVAPPPPSIPPPLVIEVDGAGVITGCTPAAAALLHATPAAISGHTLHEVFPSPGFPSMNISTVSDGPDASFTLPLPGDGSRSIRWRAARRRSVHGPLDGWMIVGHRHTVVSPES